MAFLQIAGLPGDFSQVTDGPGKVLHTVEDILDDLEEVPGFVREVLGFVEKFPGFVRDLMDNMGEVPGFVREIMGVVEYLPGFGRDLFRLTGDILFFAGDIRNFVRNLRISSGIAIGRRKEVWLSRHPSSSGCWRRKSNCNQRHDDVQVDGANNPVSPPSNTTPSPPSKFTAKAPNSPSLKKETETLASSASWRLKSVLLWPSRG